MEKKNPVCGYGEFAVQVTVSGWACKNCGRFWGDGSDSQHMANWCCATHVPCSRCGASSDKNYTACRGCREVLRFERFNKLLAVEWDGVSPIYDDAGDRFLFEIDEIADFLCDVGAESLEQRRFHPCVRVQARSIEFSSDYFEELSDENGEVHWKSDPQPIELQVNGWLQANAPERWQPDMKHRLTFDPDTHKMLNDLWLDAKVN